MTFQSPKIYSFNIKNPLNCVTKNSLKSISKIAHKVELIVTLNCMLYFFYFTVVVTGEINVLNGLGYNRGQTGRVFNTNVIQT